MIRNQEDMNAKVSSFWIQVGVAGCATLVALSGCGKKSATEASVPPPADSTAVPPPAAENSAPEAGQPAPVAQVVPVPKLPPPPKYVTANANNVIQQSVQGDVDAFLTTQLRSFVQKNGRMPSSFHEFTVRGLDSIPKPPDGKRWVIDGTDIQVKAVSAK